MLLGESQKAKKQCLKPLIIISVITLIVTGIVIGCCAVAGVFEVSNSKESEVDVQNKLQNNARSNEEAQIPADTTNTAINPAAPAEPSEGDSSLSGSSAPQGHTPEIDSEPVEEDLGLNDLFKEVVEDVQSAETGQLVLPKTSIIRMHNDVFRAFQEQARSMTEEVLNRLKTDFNVITFKLTNINQGGCPFPLKQHVSGCFTVTYPGISKGEISFQKESNDGCVVSIFLNLFGQDLKYSVRIENFSKFLSIYKNKRIAGSGTGKKLQSSTMEILNEE